MAPRDYILDMIDQLRRVFRRILTLRQEARYEEARQEIEESARLLLGTDLDFLSTFDAASIVSLLAPPDANDASKCVAAAALFRLRGDVEEALNGEDDAYPFRIRSLEIFLRASAFDDLTGPEYAEHIHAIENSLEPYLLSADTCRLLLSYHESTGAFARIEDALFRFLRHATPGDASAVARHGAEILEHLLDRSDEVLMKGGLSREEVLEALSAIRKLEESGFHTT
jgi:hypothetical protein